MAPSPRSLLTSAAGRLLRVLASAGAWVLILVAIGPVSAAAADIEDSIYIAVDFRGSCQVQGFFQVKNLTQGGVLLDAPAAWSQDEPLISTWFGGVSGSSVYQLTLLDADHETQLFRSTAFVHHAQGADFRALLDCSTTPYQVLMSDTALPRPRATPALTAIGGGLILLGVLILWRRPRYT